MIRYTFTFKIVNKLENSGLKRVDGLTRPLRSFNVLIAKIRNVRDVLHLIPTLSSKLLERNVWYTVKNTPTRTTKNQKLRPDPENNIKRFPDLGPTDGPGKLRFSCCPPPRFLTWRYYVGLSWLHNSCVVIKLLKYGNYKQFSKPKKYLKLI